MPETMTTQQTAREVVAREIASCMTELTDMEWHPQQYANEADRIIGALLDSGAMVMAKQCHDDASGMIGEAQ